MKRISQIKARAMRKRIDELEKVLSDQRGAWCREWPGGVHLTSITVGSTAFATVQTARKLNHAVVAVCSNGSDLALYALPLGAA
jgi:hypothetical protein